MLAGSPKTVVKQIKRLREEIGCGVLNLIFDRSGPAEAKIRSIKMFAAEVMPEARPL
jgi:hypothetical protein